MHFKFPFFYKVGKYFLVNSDNSPFPVIIFYYSYYNILSVSLGDTKNKKNTKGGDFVMTKDVKEILDVEIEDVKMEINEEEEASKDVQLDVVKDNKKKEVKKVTKRMTLPKVERAIKNKDIFAGTVRIIQYDDELSANVLIVDFDGRVAILKEEDLDSQINWKSSLNFMGKVIHFTIKEYNPKDDTMFISRKEAQEILFNKMTVEPDYEKAYNATITGFIPYGAYIDIKGVYGLLKNVDFSDAYIPVSDKYKIGDTIEVKLKKISGSNKLSFEPVEKLKVDSIVNFDMFSKDQVVLGVVRSVRPWGAYVCIAPGVDALCSIPATGELEEGSKVSFKITKIQDDEKKVRGKILRVLDIA